MIYIILGVMLSLILALVVVRQINKKKYKEINLYSDYIEKRIKNGIGRYNSDKY